MSSKKSLMISQTGFDYTGFMRISETLASEDGGNQNYQKYLSSIA
jgi:hypothetical protein